MTHRSYIYNKEIGVAIQKINWHPFADNPLDYLSDESLQTPNGERVVIIKDSRGPGFTVYIGETAYAVNGNNEACSLLYSKDVGKLVE